MSRILDAIGRLLPARAPTRDEKASATGGLIAWEPLGQPVWSPRDYGAFAREGFMQNPIVYRSVRMIAEAAASVPLLLYAGEEEIDAHPLADLIASPSPDHTGPDFLEAWYGFLLVAGNAYVEAVAVGGRLRELYVLRPDRMKVIPGPNGWPEAFEYSANGTSVRFAAEPVAGVRPILHTRLFHPDNDHYGMSPIEAAAAAIDIHNQASAWNKALLDNSARPSGALVYAAKSGNMTGEQFKRLRGELEAAFQGASNAGRPMLLEGGLDWKPLSLSPKDMDFIAAKHAAARDIALALGVPPMLLGIPGDATYSNYSEAQRAFWRSTVLPLVQRMAKAFSAWLSPAYGGGLELRPDLDQVEGLSAEREALWARVERASFLTLDEKRAAVGYAPAPREEAAPQADSGDVAPSFGGEAVPFVKYSPDQPRVPSGNEDGGQWTDGGGGGSSGRDEETRDGEGEQPVRLTQASEDDVAKYSADLTDEEARGGHTLRYHVAGNDVEAREKLESRTLRTLTHTYYRKVNSTFDSIESASDFVNRVLEANKERVDLVARGAVPEDWISKRFGYFTGREAKRVGTIENVVIRKTYNVGVRIWHDPRSKKGYSILSAYPFNEEPE
jgi:HK97 family phage portal protein